MTLKKSAILLVGLLASSSSLAADALTPHQKMAREIYAETIGTPTSIDNPEAIWTLTSNLKKRFLDAGFSEDDINVLKIGPYGSMIIHYRGKNPNQKAIGFMAHLDVVTAKREDWVLEPFKLTEQDGFFIGRGTADNKAGAVGLAATFIKLKKEGYMPNRDMVLIYTGDEETDMVTTKYIAKKYQELTNVELIYNSDAGGGQLDQNGKPLGYSIQAAEKTFMTLNVKVTNPGGHSSRPRKDNAIYQLMHALEKLETYKFPARINPVTRIMLTNAVKDESGETKQAIEAFLANPQDTSAAEFLSNNVNYNAITRTTCVATMLEGGHAENALPQSAEATVNCRIMPGVNPDEVEARLNTLFNDKGVVVSRASEPSFAGPSPLREDVIAAATYAIQGEYGTMPVNANMSAGGTDGKEFRAYGVPVYGVGGMFGRKGESANAHGLNEKVRVESFYKSLTHWERLMKFATGGAAS